MKYYSILYIVIPILNIALNTWAVKTAKVPGSLIQSLQPDYVPNPERSAE